jgi:hypothetical protein
MPSVILFASERYHISVARWFSLSRTSARTEHRESRCLWNPRPPTNLARGVRRLDFWGTIPRLLIHAADVFFLEIARRTERTAKCLLPGDSSWDCRTNLFLHRL